MVLPAGSCNWPFASLATPAFAMAGEEISSAADNTASEAAGAHTLHLIVQTCAKGVPLGEVSQVNPTGCRPSVRL
jgi:hypothetical protein